MAWLMPQDPLPYRPTRVLVAGTSGAGKSSLARRIARVIDAPYIEIDGLRHGPAWTPRPEFVDDVTRFAAQERWSTEWEYEAVRPLLADRADLLVFLDLPRSVVMTRVIRRTLWRRLARVELWNGNLEPPLRTMLHDPEHIIRWAWRTHGVSAERVARVARARPSLPVVRLCRTGEIDRWVAGPLSRSSSIPPQGPATSLRPGP